MSLHLPLGDRIDWSPVALPSRGPLTGSHILVRPVNPKLDAEPLYEVSRPPDGDDRVWTYLFDGPYRSPEQMRQAQEQEEKSEDPLFFTLVRLADERPLGRAAYLRIKPEFGVIEIGAIWFAPELQRTTAATEAIYLLARHAFDDLGYRRLEWKCDALNAASRRAAQRFGFTFEGVFRKHMVIKGRSRDTAWFAITDDGWPPIRAAFEAWLSPENFDGNGSQRSALRDFRAAGRSSKDD